MGLGYPTNHLIVLRSSVQEKTITLYPNGKVIAPKSVGQAIYFDAIKQNDVIFAIGPAGTGPRRSGGSDIRSARGRTPALQSARHCSTASPRGSGSAHPRFRAGPAPVPGPCPSRHRLVVPSSSPPCESDPARRKRNGRARPGKWLSWAISPALALGDTGPAPLPGVLCRGQILGSPAVRAADQTEEAGHHGRPGAIPL